MCEECQRVTFFYFCLANLDANCVSTFISYLLHMHACTDAMVLNLILTQTNSLMHSGSRPLHVLEGRQCRTGSPDNRYPSLQLYVTFPPTSVDPPDTIPFRS